MGIVGADGGTIELFGKPMKRVSVATERSIGYVSLAATPSLAKFYEEFTGRASCESLLREQPCPITARPEEAAAIAAIQQLLG